MTLQLLRKQFTIKKVKQLQAEQSCSQTKALISVILLMSYLYKISLFSFFGQIHEHAK